MRHCSVCHQAGHDRRTHRRNPDGAGYSKGGVFHPVRAWAGYDPSKLKNVKERKTEAREAAAKRQYRKPRLKAGSPEQRSERTKALRAVRNRTIGGSIRVDAAAPLFGGQQTIHVRAPYLPDFPTEAKQLGGRYNAADRSWIFDKRDEGRVRAVLRRLYGESGEARVRTRTLRIKLNSLYDGGGSYWLAGREIAARQNRDWKVRLGDGVIVLSGGFEPRGGSARYPHLAPLPNTVLEVRDLPAGPALAAKRRHPSRISVVRE